MPELMPWPAVRTCAGAGNASSAPPRTATESVMVSRETIIPSPFHYGTPVQIGMQCSHDTCGERQSAPRGFLNESTTESYSQ